MRVRSPLDSIATLSVTLFLVGAGVVHGIQDRPDAASAAKSLTKAEIDRLVGVLDKALAAESGADRRAASVRIPLWDFARQLQTAVLTPAQERQVLAKFDAVGRDYPEAAETVARSRHMVQALRIGKPAPEITGVDLDGMPFKLSDYRGRVVALLFSGEWCGICRSDYPFTRELLGKYSDAPVTVLGIDSSRSLEAAKAVKAREQLYYRSWWDGGGAHHSEGAIARAWNVIGWPTVYVIDADGFIRFVDVRREHLLGAIEQLLTTTR
jgi:peroxiredoxin